MKTPSRISLDTLSHSPSPSSSSSSQPAPAYDHISPPLDGYHDRVFNINSGLAISATPSRAITPDGPKYNDSASSTKRYATTTAEAAPSWSTVMPPIDSKDTALCIYSHPPFRIPSTFHTPEHEGSSDSKGTFSSQPLDSGWKAWSVVLASVLIQTFAFAPTEFIFGVFEQEYLLKFPTATPSSIALIGTIGTSVTYLVGIISGAYSDRWGYRTTAFTGTLLMTAALVLASFATQLWHLYLTQGIIFGTGASLVYFSAIAAPTHWFKKKRGLAIGIGASGAGLGGFYLAPLAQYMVDSIGVQWTLRVLGLYCLVACGIASALLFTRDEFEPVKRSTEKEVTDHSQMQTQARLQSAPDVQTKWRLPEHYKETAFIMLVLFQFLLSMAYLTPVYFMELYCTHIGIPKQTGAAINGWFNAASFVSRIISGIIADMVSSNWVMLICMWGMVVAVCVIWALSKTFAVYLLFAVMFGITFSAVSTVTPVLIVDYYGPQKVASVLGAVYTASGPALLIGSLISGKILETTKSYINYMPVIEFVGALFAAAAIFATAWVVLMQRRKRGIADEGSEI